MISVNNANLLSVIQENYYLVFLKLNCKSYIYI